MKEPVLKIFLLLFSSSRLIFGSQLFSMKKNVSDICQTPVCLDAASRLSHDMDPSVNPCDDFYEFTCGGFLNSTDLKADSQRIDKFTELKSKFLKTITTILEQDNSINKNNKYLKLVKTLYKTCNNKKDSIWNFLGSIDNWPVLGSQWNENEFDFTKIILKIGNTTQWKNYFFEFSSVGDGYPIVVDPYPSDLSWEDFGGSDQASIKINEYYNNIIKKVQLIGVPAYNPNYTDDFKKIFNIEMELGRVRLSEEQKLHSTFDTIEMTLNELTSDFSFFNWQEYINYLRGYPVDLSTIIIIRNFSYMKKLQYLFNSNVEIKKSLANYIIWKHVEDNINTIFSFYHNNNINCIELVAKKLPVAVAAVYVENNNFLKIKNTINDIRKIISNVKVNFIEMIKEASWIDDKTRNKNLKKILLSKYEIGCLNELINSSKINKYYESLELFDDESLNDAMQRIKLFEQRNQLMDSNDNSWIKIVSKFGEQSAFFLINSNSIMISYMMLQDDFFDSEKPNYMNYGALGSMIGHEITHGFDFNGMNFDGEGHWSNSQWTIYSKNNFYNKSKCIIEQYNNFAVPEVGLNVNGGISQDENIADNGGIKAAYRAYKKLLNTDKKLPGLEYSPQQLFWINYANVFCEKNSNEYLRNYLYGVHPPSKFRIIGTLSNIPEFAKDFNCPSGSNMNPIKKCFIW